MFSFQMVAYSIMIFSRNWRKKILPVQRAMLFTIVFVELGASQPNWTIIDPVPHCKGMECITFGNGIFVAAGDTSEGAPDSPQYPGFIATSDDAKRWTVRNSGQTQSLHSITYGKGRFVAVGLNGYFLTSTDGIKWTSFKTGSTYYQNSIVFGNDRFLVVGGDHAGGDNYRGAILTSTDGLNWEKDTLPMDNPLDAVYGNNVFVVVGISFRSPQTTSFDSLMIITSTDCSNWSVVYTAAFERLNAIAYGDSLFVGVGDGGLIYTSIDGTAWIKRKNLEPPSNLRSIAYGNGTFLTVGLVGKVYYSRNGINWTGNVLDTTKDYLSVAYGNGKFAAIESGGTIAVFQADSANVRQKSNSKPLFEPEIIHFGKKRVAVNLPKGLICNEAKLTFFNIAGEKVNSKRIHSKNGTLSISTAGISSGIYVLSITGNNLNITVPAELLH